MSSLTQLTLPIQGSVLGQAGMLDALQQLSELQSLICMGHIMQTLLVNSVPCSWSLLTKLELHTYGLEPDLIDWSLLEQQCPQLQALAISRAIPLCLTALTSVTCAVWRLQDRFECSRLGHLHVTHRAQPNLLPSTLTSLSLRTINWWEPSAFVVSFIDDHLRSAQSLGHIRLPRLRDPSCSKFCDVC